MPAKFYLHENKVGIELQLTGNVTGQEMISINKEACKYLDCRFQIWNFLNANTVNISAAEMHQIAIHDNSVSAYMKTEKVALVGNKEVLEGVGEMYETFSNLWVGRPKQYVSRFFTSMKDANEWVYLHDK